MVVSRGVIDTHLFLAENFALGAKNVNSAATKL